MENYEPKKLIILRIYEILHEYSSADHRLHQSDIVKLLSLNYNIVCERKAVARNIEMLQQAGFDSISGKTGAYLAIRKYTDGEIRLLIDSVLTNRHVSKRYTKELTEKLAAETNYKMSSEK